MTSCSSSSFSLTMTPAEQLQVFLLRFLLLLLSLSLPGGNRGIFRKKKKPTTTILNFPYTNGEKKSRKFTFSWKRKKWILEKRKRKEGRGLRRRHDFFPVSNFGICCTCTFLKRKEKEGEFVVCVVASFSKFGRSFLLPPPSISDLFSLDCELPPVTRANNLQSVSPQNLERKTSRN